MKFVCSILTTHFSSASLQGFNFPSEAGYPLDPSSESRFYMMETHYNNPNIDQGIIDSSGVRVYYTPTLRKYDAGVISVGLDPNWRHIIPPGRPEVVSEGHCIADCTRQALPEQGINVFATLLHTHLIGEHCKQNKKLLIKAYFVVVNL